jgi:hypothetical protein
MEMLIEMKAGTGFDISTFTRIYAAKKIQNEYDIVHFVGEKID